MGKKWKRILRLRRVAAERALEAPPAPVVEKKEAKVKKEAEEAPAPKKATKTAPVKKAAKVVAKKTPKTKK